MKIPRADSVTNGEVPEAVDQKRALFDRVKSHKLKYLFAPHISRPTKLIMLGPMLGNRRQPHGIDRAHSTIGRGFLREQKVSSLSLLYIRYFDDDEFFYTRPENVTSFLCRSRGHF